jgi:hypothetical protein
LASVAAAHATTINETSAPGGDFGNTFGGATDLGTLGNTLSTPLTIPGSNTAAAAISSGTDPDFFAFTGEPAGASFTYNIVDTTRGQGRATVLNSSDANIGSTPALSIFSFTNSTPVSGSGIVPTDGTILMEILTGCECGFSYTATVAVTPTAPEPGTLADVGLGLGLAGAVALDRRRRMRKA